ncbi:hypothetical protein MMC13_002349 [Lambiella insularis]|nr:hypothetical protein [Lambiella insularis]
MGVLDKLKPATSVHQVFIIEKDETTFPQKAPRYTPLFRSPLKDHEHNRPNHHHRHHKHGDVSPEVIHLTDHNAKDSPSAKLLQDEDEAEAEDEKLTEGEPHLVRARKTSVVQLFYDLFFVANLTTFTSRHEINDANSLRSYIGFFVILWATWFQVAKYDVRFGNDSAFERLCKALQFGVMVGFAVTGPSFNATIEPDTGDGQQNLRIYQTLTLILMASRAILGAQHLAVYFWLKDYPKARVPLLAHVATGFGSALIFLALFFSFSPSIEGNTGKGIIGWYITLGVEAIFILLVSGQVRFMSFRHTPMVERLGLLTLIILGEGVIGLTQAVDKVSHTLQFSPDIIGQIIAAVGIIYAIWMLYYDQTEKKRVGRVRQELWSILHFPFHICILLVVEGQATLTVWRKIIDVTDPLYNSNAFNSPLFNDPPFDNTTIDGTVLKGFVDQFNQSLQDVFNNFSPPSNLIPNDISDALNVIADDKGNVTMLYDNVSEILFSAFVEVCAGFGIETPKHSGTGQTTGANANSQIDLVNIFYTVFTYFFAAAGLTLILLTLLLRLGRRERYRTEMVAMAMRYLVGIGLALLALMNLPSLVDADNGGAISVYLFSAWMLPTVLICYVIVVIVDNVVANHIRKKYMKWRSKSYGVAV